MSHYLCPECGQKTGVYDTRPHGPILKRRRKCPQGHRFTTFEIHGLSLEKLSQLIDWTFGQNSDVDPDMVEYFKEEARKTLLATAEEDE